MVTQMSVSMNDSYLEFLFQPPSRRTLASTQDCRFSLWESLYYLAPAGAASLVSIGLFFEGAELLASGDLALVLAHPHLFFLAASLGLGVQLLTSAVIQAVGSVTLKVLSQVQNGQYIRVKTQTS